MKPNNITCNLPHGPHPTRGPFRFVMDFTRVVVISISMAYNGIQRGLQISHACMDVLYASCF